MSEQEQSTILFVPVGKRDRASSRYRVYEIVDEINPEFNINIITVEDTRITKLDALDQLLFALKLLINAYSSDVVYIQKILLPIWYLRLLKYVSTLIYDFDDASYASTPWANDRSRRQIEQLKQTLSIVSVVVVGSQKLSDYAEQYAETVYIQPTALPRQLYADCRTERKNTEKSNKIILGWIGNPENIWYLSYYEDEIKMALDSYSNLELIIITAGTLPETPFSDRPDVSYLKWSRDSEIELLSQADIGIRPLTDDAWTRGKGGYTSVVQCMALSMPVVVSPVGMLNQMIAQGNNGYFAQKDKDWSKYIGKLVEDEELRIELGQNAFETLERERLWTHQRANDIKEIIRIHA